MAGAAEAEKNSLMDNYAAMAIGSSLGESLGGALEAALAMPQAAANQANEIRAARKRFWAAYPDKPDFAQADAEFSRLLASKDMHNLYLEILNKSFEEQNAKSGRSGLPMRKLMNKMGGGEIDGGIPSIALHQFHFWVDRVVDRLGEQNGGKPVTNPFAFGSMLLKAIKDTSKEYEFYKLQRDWAEFDRANRLPPWVKTPKDYVISLYIRYLTKGDYGRVDSKEAADFYQDLVDVLGERHVHEMAEKHRQARRDKDGDIANVAALGLIQHRAKIVNREVSYDLNNDPVPSGLTWVWNRDPLYVWEAMLGAGDSQRFILASYVHYEERDEKNAREKRKWKEAREIMHSLTLAYGQEAFSIASEKVYRATKRIGDGRLRDPKEIGVEEEYERPLDAFLRLLKGKDSIAYIRYALAKHFKLNSAQELEDEYAELVGTFGEEKVKLVAEAILGIRSHQFEVCGGTYWVSKDDLIGGETTFRLLIEGLWLLSRPENNAESLPTAMENPAYNAWAHFAPGATASYEGSINNYRVKNPSVMSLKSLNFDEAVIQVYTGKEKDLTKLQNKEPAHDNRYFKIKRQLSDDKYPIYFAFKTNHFFWPLFPDSKFKSEDPVFFSQSLYESSIRESSEDKLLIGSPLIIGILNLEPLRNEVLFVGGIKILTTVYQYGDEKFWVSDQVPGGIVKINEALVLSSFSGKRMELTSLPDRSATVKSKAGSPQDLYPKFVCNYNR